MHPQHYTTIFLIALIQLGVISSKEISDIMKEYQDWGNQHGVYLSDKLKINAKSLNEKSLEVINDIGLNEKILSIPYGLVLSVSKALTFTDEKIHKLHNYTFNETSFSYDDPFFNHYTREVIYLTLIRYLCDKENNQLKSFYAPYFNTYEDDVSYFPLFYSNQELKPLHQLDFGIKIIVRKAYVNEEKLLIKMNYDLDLNETAYVRYRHLTKSKTLLVNNETSLIPFFELFGIALKDVSNCEWKINTEANQIEVYSTSQIKRGEKVLMGIDVQSNDALLLDYGKTLENNTFITEYLIDIIHHTWRDDENIRWVSGENDSFIFDLMNLTFPSEFLPVYKEIAKEKKMPQDDATAYKLMMKNLEYYLNEYARGNDEELNANILNEVNRINVKRILDNERTLIQNRIDLIKLLMSFSLKTDL